MSLRTKIILPLFILIALLIGYLYGYWIPRSLANMDSQYQEATQQHLDSIVEGVIPLLLGRELDTIHENLDALLKKNSNWTSILLTDADGRTLYPLVNPEAKASATDGQYMRIMTMRIKYMDIDLGTLTVAVNLEPYLAQWKREFHFAVSCMLVVIAVIVLCIGVVLERQVVRPVKGLGQAAEELAQGNFAVMQLKAGDDEVGHLVDSFNTMRENLASSYNLLRQSEQKNRAITTTANDAIIMMDDSGNVSFWNPAAEGIFGYSAEEVLGRYLHSIIAPDRYLEDYEKGLHSFRETGEGPSVGKTAELTARRKDGMEFPAELSLSALQMNDRWHAVGIVRDITGRKLAESKLLESLEEKELLLHEVHHRVKNNMQVITSLLDLQLGYLEKSDPKELFSEIKNRIRTMSLVHEKLYLAKDLSQVDFSDYISSLVSNLYRFYHVDPAKIVLNLDIRNISLGIDTAIPCGLIVNELITNALKYAFPGNKTGEIQVKLLKAGETVDNRSEYELTVRDNGIGIPESLDLKEIKSLGLYLVTTLVEHQLQGTIKLDRTSGTDFSFKFRELKYRKRI